jgi:hypothetical protein
MNGHREETAFDGACDRGAISLLATLVLAGTSALAAEQPLPPQIELLPLRDAANVAKHPSLPVLYVSCDDAPESRNLVTYRLRPDGSLDAASRQACADYFSPDGTRPSFRHRLFRAAVNAEKRILYLAASPTTANSVTTYADTNYFEFAAVRLGEDGQPGEVLKPFRSETTGQQGLLEGIRYEPALHRILATYYSTIQWFDLDEVGLPVVAAIRYLPGLFEFQQWTYLPEWNRFYALRSTSALVNFVWSIGAPAVEFAQAMQITAERPRAGTLPVDAKTRTLYLLDQASERSLVVVRLDGKGTFIGLPARFDIGPTNRLAFDFSRRLLYAFGKDVLRVFTLGDDGIPKGKPQAAPLAIGEIRDVLVEEITGKVYIACSQPPSN